MLGKYSPTVSHAYFKSQSWWKPVDERTFYDAEGFDQYGYDKDNVDRAGCFEHHYYGDTDLYEDTASDWGVAEDGTPAMYKAVIDARIQAALDEQQRLAEVVMRLKAMTKVAK
jgi:hypothetical protein